MSSDYQTYTEKLVRRVKYLEGLLDTNKISYETDNSIQKIIENITTSRDLSETQLRRVLAERYSRQMFIPEVSTEGQEKLNNARVLIVGAGGIGAPAAMYLAGAGIGKLGIIDGDVVEESNLHRQIIHSNAKLGINKARSAKSSVLEFNPHINVEIFEEWLTPENAAEVLDGYDIVLDASDNANARYLVNDICIIKKKTLVSGAAIRWEGQLTVLGLGDGPCYRCLYPQCPQPHMMSSCGDGGVIGMVPGLIGILEAMEAVKLIVGVDMEDIVHKKFLMYDGKSCSFKKVKIRGRNPACISCGDNPTITDVKEYNYEAFTGLGTCVADLYVKLPDENNIVWKDFLPLYNVEDFRDKNYLLDVRPLEQYKITSIDHAVNIPYGDFMLLNEKEVDSNEIKKDKTIYVLCRRGNFSRNAAKYLMEMGYKDVKNIVGGMNEYSRDFNPTIPSL